jgi:hypothetical protein
MTTFVTVLRDIDAIGKQVEEHRQRSRIQASDMQVELGSLAPAYIGPGRLDLRKVDNVLTSARVVGQDKITAKLKLKACGFQLV